MASGGFFNTGRETKPKVSKANKGTFTQKLVRRGMAAASLHHSFIALCTGEEEGCGIV